MRELKGSDCSLLIETNLIIINSNIHSPLSSSDHDEGGFHFLWTVAKRNEGRRKSGECLHVSHQFFKFNALRKFMCERQTVNLTVTTFCSIFRLCAFESPSSPAREPLNLKLLFRLHNKTMRGFCLLPRLPLVYTLLSVEAALSSRPENLLERLRKGCLRICVATATHKFIKCSFIKVFWVQSLDDPTPQAPLCKVPLEILQICKFFINSTKREEKKTPRRLDIVSLYTHNQYEKFPFFIHSRHTLGLL